jgi:PiT family inorganic phosphate transporter
MSESLLWIVGLGLSFFMAWNLGANDAATPCDTAVGARVISARRATLLFSLFAAIGAIGQGYMNIKTIARGIVPFIDPLGAITISLSACLWSAVCTWKGLEISNTYTVVGSVIGYALVVYGSFESDILIRILLSWVISPLSSMVMSFLLYKFITRAFRKWLANQRFIQVASYLLIGSLCFSAFSFGVNDVGNATGVYVAVTQDIMGLPDNTTMLFLAALGAVGIAVGGLTWGRRVIETVAFKIVRLDVFSGLSAEFTNAVIVYMFVTIPYFLFGYGLPISTSIVGVGAIIGTAFARKSGFIDKSMIGRLVFTWLITLPGTSIISAGLYFLLSSVF